jgi:hypothetical protein
MAAEIKISALPAIVTPTLTDTFPSVQSGITKKETLQQVLTLFIANMVSGFNYLGYWNANTNSPSLASGVGTKGDVYKISVAGNTLIDGNSTWELGDLIQFNGTIWVRIDIGATILGVAIDQISTLALAQALNLSDLDDVNAARDNIDIPRNTFPLTGSGVQVIPVPVSRWIEVDLDNSSAIVQFPAMNAPTSPQPGNVYYLSQLNNFSNAIQKADGTAIQDYLGNDLFLGENEAAIVVLISTGSLAGSFQAIKFQQPEIFITGQTTNATQTVLYSFPLSILQSATLQGNIIGASSNKTDSCGGNFVISARRPSGNIAIVGSPIIEINSTTTASFTCDVDIPSQSIRVLVTGLAATTYDWKLNAKYVQV